MLPLLLMMLSGLIEFGFALNFYLDVIDAARETARFSANDDPIRDAAGNPVALNPGFYDNAQDLAKQSLKAASDNRIIWPEFDWPADPPWWPLPTFDCSDIHGDVVLSAFSVLGDTVDKRFPVAAGDTGVSMCGNYFSKLTTADVNTTLSGASIPNSGFILVEIFYEYDMILGLPWITAWAPDPIVLHAYSIMPNTTVEPTPTP